MRGIQNISNKKIVLTGAASGIGLEVLKLLADPKYGNTILAVDLNASDLDGFAPNVIPLKADITVKEQIDLIFEKAESMFKKIDIYYNNAGGPFYERYDYVDWERTRYLYDLNTIAPVYMYAKYLNHLNGRDGHLCYTISCISHVALPGYAHYVASKFGLRGFQQAIRLEKPKNMKLTCLYPVGTATRFFAADKSRAKIEHERCWPIQNPAKVAKKMVKGMAKGSKNIYPVFWCVFYPFFVVLPFTKRFYWWEEGRKFKRYIANAEAANKKA